MNKQDVQNLIRRKWQTVYSDEWLRYSYDGTIDNVSIKVVDTHCVIDFCGCRNDWFIRSSDKTGAKYELKESFKELGKIVNMKIKSETMKPSWKDFKYQRVYHIEFDVR